LDSINNKDLFFCFTRPKAAMRHTRSMQCLCELTTNSAALVFSQVAALAEDTSQHLQLLQTAQ
jgi:hypothetical protein